MMRKIFSVLLLTVMLVGMLTGCGSDVPQPEIKKAEFDFSVTYEFNGETKTVSGVYVCEYNGKSWAIDGGWSRDWKGYIKDGAEEDIIIIGTTKDGNLVELNLAMLPEYFMDDFVVGYHDAPQPYISVRLVDDEGLTFLCEPDEVEAHCGAKIISYEYDEPIQNSFSILN